MADWADAAGRARLIEIVRARSFRTGRFTLASGRESSLYFNLKPTMMDPEGAHLIARAMLDLLPAPPPDLVGGLEMGAVPIVSAIAAVSHAEGRPQRAFFVRKKPKEHGSKQAVEGFANGESLDGKRVVMVEDVTTTGGSVLQAIEAARAQGAAIDTVITILDRQEGAAAALTAAGIRLKAVLTAADFA
ncbi:MAG: orotate phosphoribosyltransferase [Maricaulaceae bacterium]|nr:orotate phosphoribosyltransferase [Maricaulaceae bacterium]